MLLKSKKRIGKEVDSSMRLAQMISRFVPFGFTPVLMGGLLAAVVYTPVACAQQDQPAQIDGSVQGGSLKRRPALPVPVVMAAPEDLTKAKLAPGYLLQMEVYNTPEMDVSLRVDAAGNVSVPLIGPVHVAESTLMEAQDAIGKALVAGEILKAPQVTLNILQFASGSVTVLGEVQSPGRVQLLAPRSLGDVLAQAGGETFAAGSNIDVQHTGSDGQIKMSTIRYSEVKGTGVLQQTMIYPGDTVIVHRAGAIYILGSVTRPGSYLMVNGGTLNLLEALSLAQGTLLRASVSEVEILRPNGETYSHLRVPLKKMQEGKVTPTPLQINDIVYVPVSKLKSLFIDASSIISAAATGAVYAVR